MGGWEPVYRVAIRVVPVAGKQAFFSLLCLLAIDLFNTEARLVQFKAPKELIPGNKGCFFLEVWIYLRDISANV